MSHENATTAQQGQSFDLLRKIDQACVNFELAARMGGSPRVEEFLFSIDEESRPSLLQRLLTQEMELRARSGEAPTLEEYRQRFPEQSRLVKYVYLDYFVPAQIGQFAIQKLLGRGSYGVVYQAWDAKLTRPVAIKVFRRNPLALPTQGSSMLVEARAAAQLRHPSVVAIHSIAADVDGDEFLVLEYVDGRPLQDLMRSERVTPQQAAALLIAVLQGLQHAHQHGLIHRDLKPSNILLDRDRRPRVTDFGLALQLAIARRTPEIAGTLLYMAPEQAAGETHLLDERTDLWAIGVILYQLLTGRLPFTGSTRQQLLEAIRYAEPKRLLEWDPTLSPALADVIDRCLAKRMSDRYPSAAEMIDDLQSFLTADRPALNDRPALQEVHETEAAVVPKGLRSFDASDRDFFLRLVPGPRDRHGVPKAVRFWARQLSEVVADQTFRVGLLYGPSGCGKSSLVRAGILPQLPPQAHVVVVEAKREETEVALARAIRRAFPKLPSDQTLAETLFELREQNWLKPGEKLLVVFDQFEQWLHGWSQDSAAPLVEALRQCDGGRVQALILVRDDFWMPATRFFQQLDVPLVEGVNTSAVDLFDPVHAGKVLEAFGVSYGRLDADPNLRTAEQRRFVEQAVHELAQDGWIMPVRLCIFAEMVKSRVWSPATLRDVGGAHGVGAAFLEEVFDGRTASPMHRLHRKAARQVLERLLPPAGTDIRGHLVAESELQQISGYADRPRDFVVLLNSLDHELRLITPSDTEWVEESTAASPSTQATSARHYQLTHDFLVGAIRSWLNQTRRRTLRGRADLRLAECAEAFAARPEARQLPSFWEWVTLLLFARKRQRKPSEDLLMRKAARRHAWRSGVVVAALLLLALVAYDRLSAVHAAGLVESLETTDSHDLPDVVGRVAEYRRWTRRLLEQQAEDEQISADQRVRIQLGLLAVGAPNIDELDERLLDADAPLAIAIGALLERYGQLAQLEPSLWKVALDAQSPPDRRLRACVALARLDPKTHEAEWHSVANDLRTQLLRDLAANPQNFNAWVEALAPVSGALIPPLQASFADDKLSDEDRFLAASVLARYFADDPEQLVEHAFDSTPRQFEVFAQALSKFAPEAKRRAEQQVAIKVPVDIEEKKKDIQTRRQANAHILLDHFGDTEQLWPALDFAPDPRLQSFLIHHLHRRPLASEDWARQLGKEKDDDIRQAIVLVLGGSPGEPGASKLTTNVINTLLRLYRDEPDSGIHGALHWTLRRLECDAEIEQAVNDLAKLGMRPGFGWYVTPSKFTMVIVDTPGKSKFGSPDTEPGRDARDEMLWNGNVDWSFAISMFEVTQQQFLELNPGYKEYPNDAAPSPDCPANAVPWLDALKYCRELSERDELPEGEWVIPPNDGLTGEFPDFRTRSGYRLPFEAEWEVACRAGTTTPRYYGFAPDLLSSYACYIANSGGATWPVGRGLPNRWGLFDMLGNVSEWCLDEYRATRLFGPVVIPPQIVISPTQPPGPTVAPVRGNEFVSQARMVRSANRAEVKAGTAAFARGFRIAHTVRRGSAP